MFFFMIAPLTLEGGERKLLPYNGRSLRILVVISIEISIDMRTIVKAYISRK